ncbi:MAG: hydroxymethylbilane synthase [Bacillota bacterium]
MRKVIVGSRGSKLALLQAGQVMEMLRRVAPQRDFVLKEIRTQGDIMPHLPLHRFGGTGVFARELENALLAGQIDMAVHSMKDLTTVLPACLTIGAVPCREDPRDVLIGRRGEKLAELPPGARVGSGSLRRVAQLRRLRPDLQYLLPLRGNLDTRLRRLAAGDFDAVVLARAGLQRLGLPEEGEILSLEDCLPAAGQGALALQIRAGDIHAADLLAPLDHGPSRIAVEGERAFLQRLQAGCQVPAGVLGEVLPGGTLRIRGIIASLDGRTALRDTVEGSAAAPRELGFALAEKLLNLGGTKILAAVRQELDSEC